MKRILSLILALLMAACALPALADAAPVEVTVLFHGSTVSDDTAVLEKLNAYLAEKIGVTVKPVWGSWANFNELVMNALNSGSDEYDMMFTCSWTDNAYSTYAKRARSSGWTTPRTIWLRSTFRT